MRIFRIGMVLLSLCGTGTGTGTAMAQAYDDRGVETAWQRADTERQRADIARQRADIERQRHGDWQEQRHDWREHDWRRPPAWYPLRHRGWHRRGWWWR